MARHVNSSFGGVGVLDVDPNALTRTRWLDETAGDTALVADLVTGNNSPPVTLDHSGPGNGCLLGYPWANQLLRDYVIQGDGDTADVDACSLWQIGLVMPAGEGGLTLEAVLDGYTEGPQPIRLEVRTTSWTLADNVILAQDGDRWVARAQGLTGGTTYVVRLVCDDISTHTGGGFQIKSVILGNLRQAVGRVLMARAPSDVGDSSELSTKTVSSATVIDVLDLDAAEVTTEALAISGYHTTQLAQTQNALIEMITGAPAGTNQTREIAPSSTQSAYHDHSRLGSEFATAPLISQIPIGSWSLGSAPEDGGGGEDGLGGWLLGKNCPGWASSDTSNFLPLFDWCGWLPHHTQGKCHLLILAYSPDGTIGAGTVPIIQGETFDGSGSSVDTGTIVAWVQLGSSKWFIASVDNLDFEQGDHNRIQLSVKCTSAAKIDGSSLRIAGISVVLTD